MTANPQAKRDSLYATLMGEIKTRVQSIYVSLSRIKADRNAPTAFTDVESCVLQIRFICELVALGALLAHEGLGLNKRLRKDWNAEAIFDALSKVNPHCFPHPVKAERDATGRLNIGSPPGLFLNRQGLQKIYSECGRLLHRGSLKQAPIGFAKNYDVDEINVWLNELKKLLSDHVVLILPEGQILLVHMFGGPTGEVVVYRAILPEWPLQE